MSRKLWRVLGVVMVCCAAMLAACGQQGEVRSGKARLAPTAPWSDVRTLVGGNSAFALDLYRQLSTGDGNVIFSPYSLSAALAMVYGGARGETAQQMAAALHFDLPQEEFHAAFNALDQNLLGRSQPEDEEESEGISFPTEAFVLNIANAVWAQKGYPYRQEYLDLLAEDYGAGMRVGDFERAPERAVREINAWASEQTEGRIPQILESLNPDTRLVVANAVYFKARWEEPFSTADTQPEPFYLLDGSEVEAPLMHREGGFDYAEGDGWQAIELPYEGGAFGMVIVLPREGRYDEIEGQLTGEMLAEVTAGLETQLVTLALPKFSFETPVIAMGPVLGAMGMLDAFTEAADFSGIAEADLRVSSVVHKAFIAVDEKGTEAAAVSAVMVEEVSKEVFLEETPVEMRADRPFVFAIRDSLTGTILFVGRVMDPTAE